MKRSKIIIGFKPLSGIYLWPAMVDLAVELQQETVSNPSREFTSGQPPF